MIPATTSFIVHIAARILTTVILMIVASYMELLRRSRRAGSLESYHLPRTLLYLCFRPVFGRMLSPPPSPPPPPPPPLACYMVPSSAVLCLSPSTSRSVSIITIVFVITQINPTFLHHPNTTMLYE